jgi:hypothetical protein
MLYFRKIEIDSYQEIVDGALTYLKTAAPDIYNRTYDTTYYPLNLEKLLEYCPELETAFDRYSLKCNLAVAYVMYTNSHSTIHVDNFYHSARINIPLVNCIGTRTLFFSGGEYADVHNPLTLTNAKKIKSHTDLRLVNNVEIDTATVVRVNEPHSVIMTKYAPRITLSLGFDKDPAFLLEDQTPINLV